MVGRLIEAKADVNSKDIYGRTPLHLAAAYGHERVAVRLLEAKADVNSKNDGGRTPLQYARDGVAAVLRAAGARE